MNTCNRATYRATFLLLLIAVVMAVGGCVTTSEVTDGAEPAEWSPPEVLETQEGVASYYANKFQGRLTANGERYNKSLLTAAHRTYPFGTVVRVTRIGTGKAVLVRVNDRGPYRDGRIIDLSRAAAKELSMIRAGIVPVKVEVLRWGENEYASGQR